MGLNMIKEYDHQYDTIIGNNIILRKAKEDDYLSMLVNIWSNEEVYKWMLFTPTNTIEDAKDRIKRSISFQENHYCYFIALKNTDEAIGFCGMEEIEDNVYRECGIGIGPMFQGKGYGKEVLDILLDLAFNKLGANSFIYGYFIDNIRSATLASHYHFKYLETLNVIRSWDNARKVINNYILTKDKYLLNIKPKEKVIETKRLVLKGLTSDDEFDFIELSKDPLIKKTYMIYDFENHEHEVKYFNRIKDLTNLYNHYSYGIFLNNKVIGFINDVFIEEKVVEVGYFISPKEWNRGYATEALKAYIAMLFRIGFERIEAGFFEGNEGSKRVMEKSGMKLINKQEKIEYLGQSHNCIYYAIENK